MNSWIHFVYFHLAILTIYEIPTGNNPFFKLKPLGWSLAFEIAAETWTLFFVGLF